MASKQIWDAASVASEAVSLKELLEKEFKIEVQGPFDIGLDSIEYDADTQVREDGGQKFDRHLVGQYSDAMKNGAIFPPIVLNDGRNIVDGNSRKEAARQNTYKTAPVLIAKTENQLIDQLIGGFLNQRGGVRLRDREAASLARELAANGMTATEIARRLAYSPNKINKIIKATKTEARAVDMGIQMNGVSDDVKARLADIHSDPAFRESVKLAQDGRLRPAQVGQIVKALPESGEDSDYVAVVTAKRTEWAEQIAQVQAGLLEPRPSYFTLIKMHLGALDKLDTNKVPEIRDEATRLDMISRLTAGIDKLTAVRTAIGG